MWRDSLGPTRELGRNHFRQTEHGLFRGAGIVDHHRQPGRQALVMPPAARGKHTHQCWSVILNAEDALPGEYVRKKYLCRRLRLSVLIRLTLSTSMTYLLLS